MELSEVLALLLFVGLGACLMAGFPVSFTLAGTSLVFAGLGAFLGVFDFSFFGFLPNRIFGTMTNAVLIAVPLFIFMGVMLERSKVAEELLTTMGALFGSLRGGLGISVCIVGALLAASTGIVGATVVTMGLQSQPTMLSRGYDPKLATGAICASGTLGQIIPPSIVLVVLGDQISIAYQQAQYKRGNLAPDPVSVGDLFAGAVIPGLILVGLYIVYIFIVGLVRPSAAPPMSRSELGVDLGLGALLLRTAKSLAAPIVLMVAVLGSILAGVATPTEAAAVGAVGATLLGGMRVRSDRSIPIYAAFAGLVLVLILTAAMDLRLGRDESSTVEVAGIVAAAICCFAIVWGVAESLWRLKRLGTLDQVMRTTARLSAMIFGIIIGAAFFSLVFRGLKGDDIVHEFLTNLPGGPAGAMIMVMLIIFVLGFFLDLIEINFVVVPIVAPVLLLMGFNPVWLGIMIAMNLQTSFLTPPFGFALFYLRGVAPPQITTGHIYRGIIPFVSLQLAMLAVLAAFPGMTLWLPKLVYGTVAQ